MLPMKMYFVGAADSAPSREANLESLEQRRLMSTLPTGFVDAKIIGGIAQGTAMALAPDGRLFVAQQAGKLRVVKNNALLSAPFTTVSTTTTASEGLIGVTVDPAFSSNRYLYVSYTKTNPLRTVISRFTANGDVAAVGSEKVIFSTAPLQNHQHNGGALAFGPDGKYTSRGETILRLPIPNR
jgi:glucose/arabinose dehydrogenase